MTLGWTEDLIVGVITGMDDIGDDVGGVEGLRAVIEEEPVLELVGLSGGMVSGPLKKLLGSYLVLICCNVAMLLPK